MKHLCLNLGGDALAPSARGVVKLSFGFDGKRVDGPGISGSPDGMELFLVGNDYVAPSVDEVVVVGDAIAPSTGSTKSEVRCSVGRRTKRLAVFGRRFVVATANGVSFSAPETFTRIPLTNANAYGGVDGRVPAPQPTSPEELMRLMAAHPGMYPRNPAGKGYVVLADPPDGVELPNLENPDDLLTPERLVVGRPDRWWQMPLPWTLGYRDLAMFPRLLPIGCTPWFDAPEDDTLEEVRRGALPAGYRSHPGRLTHDVMAGSAPVDMSFPRLDPGTPIEVRGVQPESQIIRAAVPVPPDMAFDVEGTRCPVETRSSRYVVHADARRLDVIHHVAIVLPRTFIPRVHKYIPVRLRAEGVGTLEYAPPPTVHDVLVQAGVRQERRP